MPTQPTLRGPPPGKRNTPPAGPLPDRPGSQPLAPDKRNSPANPTEADCNLSIRAARSGETWRIMAHDIELGLTVERADLSRDSRIGRALEAIAFAMNAKPTPRR